MDPELEPLRSPTELYDEDELQQSAAMVAHQAHEQQQKQQAEAKAKQEAKAKAAKAKAKANPGDEAAAPPPPMAEAEAPPPMAEAEAPPPKPMPATFAGRHPPQKAVAAVRFRSEQKQWYAIRKMWDDEGLEDSMNYSQSQRSFWDHMRMHIRLTDNDYNSKAPDAWRTWKRDHLVRPRRQ